MKKSRSSWPKVKSFVGLHAKSYTWIVAFDSWARNFLSCIYNSPGLDEYYTDSLKHYHTYKDRHVETTRYLNYLVTTDVSRIDWMYLSKTFSRKTFIELLSYLETLLLNKDKDDDIKQELYDNWCVSSLFIIQVRETKAKVNEFLGILYHYLKSLVIQLLLTNRDKKHAYDADKLRTDAFSVLLSMIEKYQLHHQGFKVPFTSQLMWLSKPKKKEIIEYEMWGFGCDSKILSINLTSLDGDNYSTTENRTLNLEAIEKLQEQDEVSIEQEELSQGVDAAIDRIPTFLKKFVMAITERTNVSDILKYHV